MKALSIKQPFAELILSGRKKIELRKWNTKFRGTFYIHASKIPDEKAMEKFKFKDLPCGCVVGKVDLVDVKKYENEEEFLKDKNKHLGLNMSKCGFILENPERVEPFEYKGRLGFFEIK